MERDTLKLQLKADCEHISYRTIDEVKGYNPTGFLDMIKTRDIVDVCESLLKADETPPDGYTNLFFAGRLDLSLERLITDNPKYHVLLSPEAIRVAKERCTVEDS